MTEQISKTKTSKRQVSGTDNWPKQGSYRASPLKRSPSLIIMSFILATVRPQNLQNWIAANAAGSLKGTAGDSWRAYLAANGGTGKSLYDLEQSYLTAQSVAPGTLHDRWNAKVAASAGKSCQEKLHNFFK